MGALIKNHEWKLGFNGEYWIPVEVIKDHAAGTTSVTMGLYKNQTLYDEVKDEPQMRSVNILARKAGYRLEGIVADADITAGVQAYVPIVGPHPGMGQVQENFFSDAELI